MSIAIFSLGLSACADEDWKFDWQRAERIADGGSPDDPAEDGGTTNPDEDGGTTGPEEDGGTTGPEEDGGSTGPEEDGGTTPSEDGGSTNPEEDGGTTGPEEDGGSTGPEEDGGTVVNPDDDAGTGTDDDAGTTPSEDGGSTNPEEDGGSAVTPEEDAGTGTADDAGTTPSEDGGSTNPEEDGGSAVTPEEDAGTGAEEDAGTGADDDAGTGADDDAGTGAEDDAGSGADDDAGTGAEEDAGTGAEEDAGTGAEEDAGTGAEEDAGTGAEDDAGTGAEEDAGTGAEEDAGTVSEEDAGTGAADDAGTDAEEDAGTGAEEDAGTGAEEDAGTGAEEDAGTGAEEDAGTGADDDAGTGAEEDAGTGAEEDAGTGAEDDAGTGTEEDAGTDEDAGEPEEPQVEGRMDNVTAPVDVTEGAESVTRDFILTEASTEAVTVSFSSNNADLTISPNPLILAVGETTGTVAFSTAANGKMANGVAQVSVSAVEGSDPVTVTEGASFRVNLINAETQSYTVTPESVVAVENAPTIITVTPSLTPDPNAPQETPAIQVAAEPAELGSTGVTQNPDGSVTVTFTPAEVSSQQTGEIVVRDTEGNELARIPVTVNDETTPALTVTMTETTVTEPGAEDASAVLRLTVSANVPPASDTPLTLQISESLRTNLGTVPEASMSPSAYRDIQIEIPLQRNGRLDDQLGQIGVLATGYAQATTAVRINNSEVQEVLPAAGVSVIPGSTAQLSFGLKYAPIEATTVILSADSTSAEVRTATVTFAAGDAGAAAPSAMVDVAIADNASNNVVIRYSIQGQSPAPEPLPQTTLTVESAPGETEDNTLIVVSSIRMTEGETRTLRVQLARAPAAGETVTVLLNGLPARLAATPSTVDLTASQPSGEFTLTLTDDSDFQEEESGQFTVSATGLTDATVSYTLVDNDKMTLSSDVTGNAVNLDEGSSTTVNLSRNGPRTLTSTAGQVEISVQGQGVTVSPASLDLSAATDGSFTISAPEDSNTVSETATVTVSGPNFGTLTFVVHVADQNTLGLNLNPSSLTVVEGEEGSYEVTLTHQPSGPVTVTGSRAQGGASEELTSLVFNAANWNTAQIVAVNPAVDNTATSYGTITDTWTLNGSTQDVAITVTDTTVQASGTGFSVNESAVAALILTLNHAQESDVTVQVTATDGLHLAESEAAAATGEQSLDVVFSASETTATIYVYAVDNNVMGTVNTDQSLTLTVQGIANSLVGSVAVTVNDATAQSLVLSELTDNALSFAEGATGSFGVALGAEPSGETTVSLTLPEGARFSASASTLTFTADNWNTAQTVALTGTADNTVNASVEAQTLAIATAGAETQNVAVTVTDATYHLALNAGTITEGDTPSGLTVTLSPTPPEGVTVTYTLQANRGALLGAAGSTPASTTYECAFSSSETECQFLVLYGNDHNIADGSFTISAAAPTDLNAAALAAVSFTATNTETQALRLVDADGQAFGEAGVELRANSSSHRSVQVQVGLALTPEAAQTITLAGGVGFTIQNTTNCDGTAVESLSDVGDTTLQSLYLCVDDARTEDTASTFTVRAGAVGVSDAQLAVRSLVNRPILTVPDTTNEGTPFEALVSMRFTPRLTTTATLAGSVESTSFELNNASISALNFTSTATQTVSVTVPPDDASTADRTYTLSATAYNITVTSDEIAETNQTVPQLTLASGTLTLTNPTGGNAPYTASATEPATGGTSDTSFNMALSVATQAAVTITVTSDNDDVQVVSADGSAAASTQTFTLSSTDATAVTLRLSADVDIANDLATITVSGPTGSGITIRTLALTVNDRTPIERSNFLVEGPNASQGRLPSGGVNWEEKNSGFHEAVPAGETPPIRVTLHSGRPIQVRGTSNNTNAAAPVETGVTLVFVEGTTGDLRGLLNLWTAPAEAMPANPNATLTLQWAEVGGNHWTTFFTYDVSIFDQSTPRIRVANSSGGAERSGTDNAISVGSSAASARTVYVSLSGDPEGPVTVNLTRGANDEFRIAVGENAAAASATLSFTSANWNNPQAVTLSQPASSSPDRAPTDQTLTLADAAQPSQYASATVPVAYADPYYLVAEIVNEAPDATDLPLQAGPDNDVNHAAPSKIRLVAGPESLSADRNPLDLSVTLTAANTALFNHARAATLTWDANAEGSDQGAYVGEFEVRALAGAETETNPSIAFAAGTNQRRTVNLAVRDRTAQETLDFARVNPNSTAVNSFYSNTGCTGASPSLGWVCDEDIRPTQRTSAYIDGKIHRVVDTQRGLHDLTITRANQSVNAPMELLRTSTPGVLHLTSVDFRQENGGQLVLNWEGNIRVLTNLQAGEAEVAPHNLGSHPHARDVAFVPNRASDDLAVMWGLQPESELNWQTTEAGSSAVSSTGLQSDVFFGAIEGENGDLGFFGGDYTGSPGLIPGLVCVEYPSGISSQTMSTPHAQFLPLGPWVGADDRLSILPLLGDQNSRMAIITYGQNGVGARLHIVDRNCSATNRASDQIGFAAAGVLASAPQMAYNGAELLVAYTLASGFFVQTVEIQRFRLPVGSSNPTITKVGSTITISNAMAPSVVWAGDRWAVTYLPRQGNVPTIPRLFMGSMDTAPAGQP